jgi:hypothetical protein
MQEAITESGPQNKTQVIDIAKYAAAFVISVLLNTLVAL